MPQRISHSLLDPYLTKPLKAVYARLPIPSRLPPEAIVAMGHVSAIIGAVGFAMLTQWWWAGLIAAAGVALNHICDVLDGTHARSTGQCRNGGELLDHFVDPLSFSYWILGLAFAAGAPWVAVAGVVCIYATAVLTNIKAKLTGQFELAAVGPTEFKTGLILIGTACGFAAFYGVAAMTLQTALFWGLATATVLGLLQLVIQLHRAVREVNQVTVRDTTEWETTRAAA